MNYRLHLTHLAGAAFFLASFIPGYLDLNATRAMLLTAGAMYDTPMSAAFEMRQKVYWITVLVSVFLTIVALAGVRAALNALVLVCVLGIAVIAWVGFNAVSTQSIVVAIVQAIGLGLMSLRRLGRFDRQLEPAA